MESEHYYHMFANGDDAKNFITNQKEFKAAFNRFAVCQHLTGVSVLSHSVEDTHPHALLKGSYEACTKFKWLYEDLSIRSIVQQRGSKDGVILNCELDEIDSEQYLMNVGTYTIIQATKDGKAVMPYDYLYGTGALYFRSPSVILPWYLDECGNLLKPVRYGDLTALEQRHLCATKHKLPEDWLVCNGFVLPNNYVDVKGFEAIYRTHNCFRAFLSSSKARDTEILNRMAACRGIMLDDLEARRLCRDKCQQLFSKDATRHLTTENRITLARILRKDYLLSYRQLSILVKVPEMELRKYVK